MAKNTNRVASAIAYVAALGLATGVWAAHWEMTANNPVTYAKEIFGADDPATTGLTLSKDDDATTPADEQTSIDLVLYLPNDAGMSVGANSELEVTLELHGGHFGQAVNWTDIEAMGDAAFTKVGGSQKDGRRNDSTVTLRVATSAEITVADTASVIEGTEENVFAVSAERTIRFNIGSIVGYGGAGAVTASASARVTDGPSDNFPTEVQSAPRAMVAKVDVGDTLTLADGTTRVAVAADVVAGVGAVSNKIADSADAMVYSATGGPTKGQIDLADRTALKGMTKVEIASFTHGANPMADAKTSDGVTSFSAVEGMEANVMVTVTGMVRANDMIWFDQNNDGEMSTRETLTIAGGAATRTFRIDNITSGSSVYFMPNGDDDMTDGSLMASFAVEYDDEDWVTPASKSGMVALEYSGITMHARAYAIPGPDVNDTGVTDIGNVRIKCHAEGDSTCTVFLDCDEDDGTRHFEEVDHMDHPIAAGGTLRLNSSDIAMIVLGSSDMTWDGRLSCDVFSDDEVSVQVLVRNRSGHPLINNTYID